MTVHSTALKFDVYSDEMIPVLRALKFAQEDPEFRKLLTLDQRDALYHFVDAFSDFALDNAA